LDSNIRIGRFRNQPFFVYKIWICAISYLVFHLDPCNIFQHLDSRADIFISMPSSDGCLEKLTTETGQKKRHFQLLSRFQHKSHIFVHPLYGKVRSEVAAEDEGGLIVDQSRFRGAV